MKKRLWIKSGASCVARRDASVWRNWIHKWNTTNINIMYAPLGSYIAENCGLSEISRNEQREKMRYIDGLNCQNFAEIFSFISNHNQKMTREFRITSQIIQPKIHGSPADAQRNFLFFFVFFFIILECLLNFCIIKTTLLL